MYIKEYLIKITALLKEANEQYWVEVFENLIYNFDEIEFDETVNKIKKLYAGMGSFNDLVLHRNGTPCIEENELLDSYKKELFKEIISLRGK